MPLDAALDALSGMLAAARNKRALIDPGAVAIPRSIEEAIAVQDAVNARVGGQPRGWKIALRPDGSIVSAPLLDFCLRGDGAAMALPAGKAAIIEIEIAYRLARDVRPGSDREEVMAAIGEVVVGAEIVGSRLARDDCFMLFMADHLGNAGYVAGTGMPMTTAMAANPPCMVRVDGQTVFAQSGTHGAGHPLTPLLAMAADPQASRILRADQLITTGTLTGTLALDRPCTVEAWVEDVGSVSFTLEDPQAADR